MRNDPSENKRVEIKSVGGDTLYVAENASNVDAALIEAVAAGANLADARLTGAKGL